MEGNGEEPGLVAVLLEVRPGRDGGLGDVYPADGHSELLSVQGVGEQGRLPCLSVHVRYHTLHLALSVDLRPGGAGKLEVVHVRRP